MPCPCLQTAPRAWLAPVPADSEKEKPLLTQPRSSAYRSQQTRWARALPHLAACLLGGHVFCLVPGSPKVCEPENIARHGMDSIEAVARELSVPMLRCLQPLTPLHPQLS